MPIIEKVVEGKIKENGEMRLEGRYKMTMEEKI